MCFVRWSLFTRCVFFGETLLPKNVHQSWDEFRCPVSQTSLVSILPARSLSLRVYLISVFLQNSIFFFCSCTLWELDEQVTQTSQQAPRHVSHFSNTEYKANMINLAPRSPLPNYQTPTSPQIHTIRYENGSRCPFCAILSRRKC